MVDLVGEPGNVHDPDSSINGCLISLIPSPLQSSNLKQSRQPYMDDLSHCDTLNAEERHTLLDVSSDLGIFGLTHYGSSYLQYR